MLLDAVNDIEYYWNSVTKWNDQKFYPVEKCENW